MIELKQTILKFTTIVALIGGVAACAHTATSHHSATTYKAAHVLDSDQICPANLTLKVGETLQFHAPENPSTGYIWSLQAPLALFKVTSHYASDQIKTQDQSAQMVGVGGTRQYTFTAVRAGEENIHLNYLRPWETHTKPAKSWQCAVTIVEHSSAK